jgi:hypothetical protein
MQPCYWVDYEPLSALLVVLKVLLALVPNAVIATRQTTIMRANITAYSTAVGPLSSLTNTKADRTNLDMRLSFADQTKLAYVPVRSSERVCAQISVIYFTRI